MKKKNPLCVTDNRCKVIEHCRASPPGIASCVFICLELKSANGFEYYCIKGKTWNFKKVANPIVYFADVKFLVMLGYIVPVLGWAKQTEV